MIDKSLALSVTRQAELLDLSRSNVYYLPQAVPQSDLALMRRRDELHLKYHSPAPGCCATCSAWKALRWAAGMLAR